VRLVFTIGANHHFGRIVWSKWGLANCLDVLFLFAQAKKETKKKPWLANDENLKLADVR
jgi:hypothetical protein